MPNVSRSCKESISPETIDSILQAIADLLATATSETEYNVLRFWKETLQQLGFLYDIQQRNTQDHSNGTPRTTATSSCRRRTSTNVLGITNHGNLQENEVFSEKIAIFAPIDKTT